MAADRDLTKMTTDQIDDFYERWKEWMLAITRRDGLMVMHPKYGPFFGDLIERLANDVWWKVAVPKDVLPMMRFDPNVRPIDSAYIWTAIGKVQTPAEFFGRTGFGRLNIAVPSSAGVRGWDTFTPPKDFTPPKPDEPGEFLA